MKTFCILFYKSLKFSSADTLRRTHPMNNSRSKKNGQKRNTVVHAATAKPYLDLTDEE